MRTYSFRSDTEDLKNLVPTDVRINLASRSSDVAGRTFSTSGSMIAFKKGDRDDGFEIAVKDHLLALIGQPRAEIKKSVARLLSQNEIFSVDDSDILDCVVTARRIGGRGSKSIYIFGEGHKATRFSLDTKLDADGLPLFEETINAMLKKLQEEVIAKVVDG